MHSLTIFGSCLMGICPAAAYQLKDILVEPLSPEAKADDTAYIEVESLRMNFSFIDPDTKMEPYMRQDERALFYQLLDHAENYLEFGSGGSTIAALQRDNIRRIHTVESATDWMSTLNERKDVSSAISSGRMKFVHADIGPTKAWGFPVGESHKKQFPGYSGNAAKDSSTFDLVFVDGRFRVACMLKALRRIQAPNRSDVVFAMHDYTDRSQYHIVGEFMDGVKVASRLQVFRSKKEIDEVALQKRIEEYEYNPE